MTGHAADIYDPKAVRASTGSLFCLCLWCALAAYPQNGWTAAERKLSGLMRAARSSCVQVDLARPTILVVGNETHGMSAAWRDACHVMAHIPIGGGASSLNAAAAVPCALRGARDSVASVIMGYEVHVERTDDGYVGTNGRGARWRSDRPMRTVCFHR